MCPALLLKAVATGTRALAASRNPASGTQPAKPHGTRKNSFCTPDELSASFLYPVRAAMEELPALHAREHAEVDAQVGRLHALPVGGRATDGSLLPAACALVWHFPRAHDASLVEQHQERRKQRTSRPRGVAAWPRPASCHSGGERPG